jgi:hypothetical protein
MGSPGVSGRMGCQRPCRDRVVGRRCFRQRPRVRVRAGHIQLWRVIAERDPTGPHVYLLRAGDAGNSCGCTRLRQSPGAWRRGGRWSRSPCRSPQRNMSGRPAADADGRVGATLSVAMSPPGGQGCLSPPTGGRRTDVLVGVSRFVFVFLRHDEGVRASPAPLAFVFLWTLALVGFGAGASALRVQARRE